MQESTFYARVRIECLQLKWCSQSVAFVWICGEEKKAFKAKLTSW